MKSPSTLPTDCTTEQSIVDNGPQPSTGYQVLPEKKTWTNQNFSLYNSKENSKRLKQLEAEDRRPRPRRKPEGLSCITNKMKSWGSKTCNSRKYKGQRLRKSVRRNQRTSHKEEMSHGNGAVPESRPMCSQGPHPWNQPGFHMAFQLHFQSLCGPNSAGVLRSSQGLLKSFFWVPMPM